MKITPRTIVITGVVLLVGWIGYRMANAALFGPRSERLATYHAQLEQVNTIPDRQRELIILEERIGGFVDRTLGDSVERVEHRMRTRLNRIGEFHQVRDLSVTTPTSRGISSPARTRINPRNPQRGEPDFVEVDAMVRCDGELEQILRFVHDIDREPWLKRIDQMTLDPREEGTRISLTLRLTTMFLPGRMPSEEAMAEQTRDPATFGPYETIAKANPFRIPPPPPPPDPPRERPQTREPDPPPPPPPPPPFPYGDWRLTAIMQGTDGREIWLNNVRNNNARILRLGDTLGEAELVEIRDEYTVFRLGDDRFQISVGATLADRGPLSR